MGFAGLCRELVPALAPPRTRTDPYRPPRTTSSDGSRLPATAKGSLLEYDILTEQVLRLAEVSQFHLRVGLLAYWIEILSLFRR